MTSSRNRRGASAVPIPSLLEFPLRGEWRAFRTPAAAVPTHGTDFLGQRYAYDFVRPTQRRWGPFGPNVFQHFCLGVPAAAFPAWGAPVTSATVGRVVGALDGRPDLRWVHGLWTYMRLSLIHRLFPVRISHTDWAALVGNHVLVDSPLGIVLYAHLRNGSIRRRRGERVAVGDPIGSVGNSGRSAMPHLHFQVMDRVAFDAAGVPCGFRGFERWDGALWTPASGYPGAHDLIRNLDGVSN